MIGKIRTLRIAAMTVAAILCAPGDASASDDDERAYAAAAEHFQQARWKQAAEAFEHYLGEAPEHAWVEQARFYRAESLLRDGRPAEAAEAFATFLQHEPSSALRGVALFRAGEAHYLADRRDEARRRLEQALAADPAAPTTPRAWFYLGDLAAVDEDFATAATAMSIVAAAFPDDPLYAKAVLGRARAELQLGNLAAAAAAARPLTFGPLSEADIESSIEASLLAAEAEVLLKHDDEAAAVLRRAAAARPDDLRIVDVLSALGKLESRRGRHQAALDAFEQIERRFPQHPRCYAALYDAAWELQELRRPADAERKWVVLCETYESCPLYADAAYRLAEAAMRRGDHEAAYRRACEAAKVAGAELSPHVLLLQGQAAAELERWPEADAALAKLEIEHRHDGVTPIASFWRAEIPFRRGDYESAVARFQAIVKSSSPVIAPSLPTAWLRLAQAQAERREWPEVLAAAREAKARFPQFEQAYELDYLRGRAHAARAEMLEARAAYGDVLSDARSRGTETAALARFMIAETYFHQRNFEAAATAFTRVGGEGTPVDLQAAALLQAGKCQEHLGRAADALSQYDRILKDFATSPYAAEAAGRRTEAARAADASQRK